MSSKLSQITPTQLLDAKTALIDNITETFQKIDLIQDGTGLNEYLKDKTIYVLSTNQFPMKYIAIIDELSDTQEKIYLFTESASFVHDYEIPQELQSSLPNFEDMSFERILGNDSENSQDISDLFKSKIAKLFKKVEDSSKDLLDEISPNENAQSVDTDNDNSGENDDFDNNDNADDTDSSDENNETNDATDVAYDDDQCNYSSYIAKYTKIVGTIKSADAKDIFGDNFENMDS